MALTRVRISPEVFLSCCTHALSTEAEEVMGLLLGQLHEEPGGATTATIWMALPQIRTDRRKDRVETSPEQMASASAAAEAAGACTGRPTRVVGWYHSHPHITVLPSHVDLRTQALYQLLDPGFVGLIVSVFNSDAAAGAQRVQVTAFQSLPAGGPGGTLAADLADLDSETATAIRAAVAAEASHALASGGGAGDGWERKEVPLEVGDPPGGPAATLDDFVSVQRILLDEERASFLHEQEAAASCDNPAQRELRTLHASAAYHQALCQLMELALAPALLTAETQAQQASLHKRQLEAQVLALQAAEGQRDQESDRDEECIIYRAVTADG